MRYADFVGKPARSRRWILFSVIAAGLVAASGAVAAFMLLGSPFPGERPKAPPALSAVGAPVKGEAYQWKRVAIGGGGMISGLSISPGAETFVARADVYGAFIWDAQANRWAQLVTEAAMPAIFRAQNGIADGVYEIVVAPSRPNRIYMAVKGRVFRSDDRGRSFVLAGASNPFPFRWDANSEYRLHGPFMAVDPADPDLVLLGTPANGLWRSQDAGATWARVASVPTSKDRKDAPDIQAPGTMLWYEQPAGGKPTGRIFALASGSGMYVSRDRGLTFTPLASGAQPMTLQRGGFDRRGSFFGVDDATRSIWSFKDGRWRDLTSELGLAARDYAAIAANPRADQIFIFDRGGAGYTSVDGGERWMTVSHSASVGAGDPPWLRVADQPFFTTADIRFDPVRANRLWVASGVGVFHADVEPGSTGVEWVSQTRGIEELVANDVIHPPGGAPLFAGWDFGIHVKPDLAAYSTTFAPGERSLMSVQQLDWTPAKPGVIVTNASDARMGCCSEDGNAVMAGVSTNGGADWRKFAALPTPPGTKDDDPWRMSFGTIAVSSSDAANIVWAPAFNRQPYYTMDSGRSWKPVILEGATGDTPGSFAAFYYQRKTLAADKSAPATFYLYHSGEAPNGALVGLWRTRDGGASWIRVFAGEIAPSSNMAAKLRSVPGHAGHLFFTSAFEHVSDTGLRRSSDGGATWRLVPDVTRVDDIAFGKAAPGASYPAIYISGQVGGEYGIWRSVNNGSAWHRLAEFPVGTLDQVTVIGADPDIFGRVYLGYKGSGWIWGEPAPCKPAAYAALADTHCAAVR
ncbi:hypothetical protein K9B35_00065 [Sphingomonas sp. R647]|uniref:WD40/YVTN/BNR-like repeat-containing protein n=1 Tax=Sphingomonas sp. R647 TaxID=2875233 RepID=UPI001CD72BA1|nr:hypothetical protein [Sphingomonas sp. R647]MCA1196348.1 hypothetical protein [Sphingomonas sp. R647]